MAEKGYFFDSTEDDKRIYQAADLARFFAPIIGNGFSNTPNLPDLEVKAKSNMDISVGAGQVYMNGYMYENDSTMTLTHDIADPDNDRIDRVVVRFDNNPEKRQFYAYIKKGTAGEDNPPSLTNDDYVTEISVAKVKINAGKSYIEDGDITDERAGNYIDLHNIKQGVKVDEYGMVYMPNQSYVEMVDSSDLKLNGDDSVSYVPTDIPIRPDIDKQKEVSDGTFHAKADGVYQFYVHLALESGQSLGDREKLEFYLVINDDSSIDKRVYLFNQPGVGYSDLHFLGSGIKYLEKGDKVNVIAATRSTGDITSRYRRMSIAKIN